jgi:hypothetical protein
MTTAEIAPKTNSNVHTVGSSRAIGWLGTTARVLVGVALLALGIIANGHWIRWWQLALGIVGMPAVTGVAQLLRLKFTSRRLDQTDHLAFCLNCAPWFVLLGVAPTRDATMPFLGSSMLLAATRGDGGCESLAISNWLLRRDDQVGCLVFGPLDRLEAHRRTANLTTG